ncbi:Carboxypeptidase [Aphelenchoides fujianensis]|nr:Carboxypeptidase [Aphelenchoides fujianensis]
MRSFLPLVFVSLLLVASHSRAKAEGGEDDLVADIPAINFQPNYKTYSGYLYANQQKTWKMHYMLTTSRSNKTTDPVVFWFNGGPGCSSFTGSFQELGPMYVDANGSAIFENVYSWNSIANVVYLESPIGVGFSYDTTNVNYKQASDDQTAEQNYAAIADFFLRAQTQFKDRDFFLAGESYAGIYIPTLAAQIALNLQAFPNQNFRGVLIGNGFMHVRTLMNSLVQWSYYHGQIGNDDWTALKNRTCCQLPSGSTDTDQCDWTPYLTTKNGLDYVVGDKTTDCGKASTPRQTWYFRKRVGGYVQRYADQKNSTMDVLTLKGAGHMTMADRPGPALQMFERFLTGAANYGELDAPNPGVPLGQPLLGSGGVSGRIFTDFFFLLAFFFTLLL